MNSNLAASIATERHERLISDAAAFRRSNSSRSAAKSTRSSRRHRVAALVKDLVAASL